MEHHESNLFSILSKHAGKNNASAALEAFQKIIEEKQKLKSMFFDNLRVLKSHDTPLESTRPTTSDVLLLKFLLKGVNEAVDDDESMLWSSAWTSYNQFINEKNKLKQLTLRAIKTIHLSSLSHESKTGESTTEYELQRPNERSDDDQISNTPIVSSAILDRTENILRLKSQGILVRTGFGLLLNCYFDDNSAQNSTKIGKIVSFSNGHKTVKLHEGITAFVYSTIRMEKKLISIFHKLGNHRKK